MDDTCELFNLIPTEKINKVFESSKTAYGDCDHTFLCFEHVYKAVTLFVPTNKIIIDLGCAYAFQAWYFRDYKKYIGVDYGIKKKDMLETENSEFYFMSIQKFIKGVFPVLGYRKDEVFAICSYVEDRDARQLVKNYFPNCLVYYP